MRVKLSGLLFDNDGVVVDTMPGAMSAWRKWGERYQPGFELVASWHGQKAIEIVRQLVAPADFEKAFDLINQLELQEADGTEFVEGSKKFLDSLPIGSWNIVTGASFGLAIKRLNAAGLAIPKTLVSAEDVKLGKPDPEGYLLGAARIGIDISDCVVFEDAPAGLVAGQRAGAKFLVGLGEQTMDSVADVVIKDFEGITYTDGELVIQDNARLR
jgi:mannitol-1-/sugar-/sorbitol-6-phosphatase